MRVAGWISLIAGGLLCATLVWAPLGFLLMGVGLLSLLAAENKRKRIVRSGAWDAHVDQSIVAPPPMAAPMPEPDLRHEPTMEISAPRASYDRQAWRQLVESDEDLARVASVLADYGHQYVDELASEYLAVADKTRLPAIVDGIIGRAGVSAAPHSHPQPASEVRPVRRTNLMDRPPRPKPPARPEFSESIPDPVPQPLEPAKPETVSAPTPPPVVIESELVPEDRSNAIANADDDFAAMLGKLSPGAATPDKNR